MKKALIIITILLLIGGGTGYYFYDKEQKRIAAERAERDSIRHARDVENARLAAMEKAHRDSISDYEKTHSRDVIRAFAEKLVHEEMMSGRNHVGGKNWSERINILREQCDNIRAYGSHYEDSIFKAFSFKGLMGEDTHFSRDSVLRVYYIAPESAYVDVRFTIDENPGWQDVTYKLVFVDDHWLIDDFTFEYNDGEFVTESDEMNWFIDTFGTPLEDDEKPSSATSSAKDKSSAAAKEKPKASEKDKPSAPAKDKPKASEKDNKSSAPAKDKPKASEKDKPKVH